jgi:hypothetical protein
MTTTRKYASTFAEFATTCQINYERSESGEYVWDSAPISVDTHRDFYRPNDEDINTSATIIPSVEILGPIT